MTSRFGVKLLVDPRNPILSARVVSSVISRMLGSRFFAGAFAGTVRDAPFRAGVCCAGHELDVLSRKSSRERVKRRTAMGLKRESTIGRLPQKAHSIHHQKMNLIV